MQRKPLLNLLVAAATGLAATAFAVAFAGTANSAVDQETCRPDGLYRTPGVTVPYCDVYDSTGREAMGAGHPRRIIGYFTNWRTGKNGAPAYLASQIPWTKVTHINYAFAHVDGANKISVGTPTAANNPSTNMTWPGVAGAEMDPAYSYTGHFNLLNKFKKQYPDVKTLISVGGWAETGGYFDDAGTHVDSGGFYRMTTNADGSINTAGINAFADSVVAFLRQYGFDGVDIDYEYATSNKDAGNPMDFVQANARRAGLNASFQTLMKTLRTKLDTAAAADSKYYMVTVAAPASGWLLRGMEAYQATQYLDYINIMSYDLHGAWNQYVGPNASLFDDGADNELTAGGVYSAYSNIGYLNTDWAYHYYRGAVQSGRINVGVPYYTRGFQGVTGGNNGLWGTAPKSTNCPVGTQSPCGNGAIGIDNLWHDLDTSGNEEPAGSNPMWHAKNLENGIAGSYRAAYGLTPATDPNDNLTGTYVRNYSATLAAPWLWNATKKVFLSTEDEQSIGAKADYVVNKGIGGIMIWELAGDYAFNSTAGEYQMGNTLTNLIASKFATASPYGASKSNTALPAQTLNVDVSLNGFALGDSNYPINPKLRLTNNSTTTIPGGAVLDFDYGTSAPGTMSQQSGWAMTVTPGHTGNNIGGLKGDFHHAKVTIPSYQSIAPGANVEITLNYVLPISSPSNYTLTFGGQSYSLAVNYARGGVAPSASPSTSVGPSASASPSTPPGTCTDPAWESGKVYTGGNRVSYNGHAWRAQWWTSGETPGVASVWVDLGPCTGGSPSPSASPSASPSVSPSPSPSPSRSASPSPSASPSASPSPSASTSPGTTPAWAPNVAYATGAKVTYGGSTYQCRQPHTSIVGWEPPNVPALWLKL
ncbi:glycosyl hydrolase family 18 protein [Catellatospora sp. KI3]|uniref:chitinase C-terminal domain-containing protein n=1 Tax=Catellatospora sp. KI3 TaxID=3041620 RepID=UPI0024827A52|nr:glycosyl hydrolase family 18 protein [Catellatospora sp. KI3]MDI1459758.1 glycosyl hydrolase family 18 protein [Catellatospora sp. KI3]